MKFLYYGVSNLVTNYGVEAIIRGTEVMLSKITQGNFETYYVDFSNNDNQRKRLSDLKHLTIINGAPKNTFVRLLYKIQFKVQYWLANGLLPFPKNIRQFDAILCVGGDLYTIAQNEKNWKYPWILMKNEIHYAGKVPYYIWCASVGPFETVEAPVKEKIINHLRGATGIIVRERGSFEYLTKTCGLSNVYYGADPAFFMEPAATDLGFASHLDFNRVLAVNFSEGPIEHVVGEKGKPDNIKRYRDLLSRISRELGLDILLVPHVGRDHDFLFKHFYSELRDQINIAIVPPNQGSAATKYIVSKCRALLTMRFHCSLAGISTNVPTLLLGSTKKGWKLNNDIFGHSDFVLDMKDINENSVLEKIREVLSKREQISLDLSILVDAIKKRGLDAGKILKHGH